MSPQLFEDAFAPVGALTLHRFDVGPDLAGLVTCRALLGVDQRELDREATACGPIGAMSEILYGINAGVEIVSLYEQTDGGQIAAYLQCARGNRRCWSYGRGVDGPQAVANALISASNQLSTPPA